MSRQRPVNVEPGKQGFQRRQEGSVPDVELNEPIPSQLARDVVAASQAGPDTIASHCRSPHWEVRCESVWSPHCTDEMLAELATDSEWVVRWAVASRHDSEVGARLANDPSVVVRVAVSSRTDLSDADRATLDADQVLADVLGRIRSRA